MLRYDVNQKKGFYVFLYKIELSVDKIAESMNISVEQVNEIIENHTNKV
jgi:plasmid maintenance system antidote protein VapI